MGLLGRNKVSKLLEISGKLVFLLNLSFVHLAEPLPQYATRYSQKGSGGFGLQVQDRSSAMASARNRNSDGLGFGSSVSSEEIRKQLCPEITGSTDKFRYDKTARKCSEVGKRSHCAENMIFYGMAHNEVYGECDCSYSSVPKPLVYHPETKRCYFIYEQAYCKSANEWLAFNRQGIPECSPNVCKDSKASFRGSTIVPLHGDGACVELNQGSSDCEKTDEVVTFAPGILTPTCVKNTLLTRALSPGRSLQCRAGAVLSFSGRCHASFIW